MARFVLPLGLGLLLAMSVGTVMAAPLTLASPGGRVQVTVDADGQSVPTYAVSYRGQAVITPSVLGLSLVQGGALGPGLEVAGSTRRGIDETYPVVAGKAATARDHFNELVVSYADPKAAGRTLQIVFRAYEDGVAFRYRLPLQGGREAVSVRSEATRFAFPRDYACWGLNLGRFGTSHEGEYDPVRASLIRDHARYEAPLVCKTGQAAFAITEADLKDWSGMYLNGRGDGELGVQVILSPRLDDPSVAVHTRLGTEPQSPWRVIMLGDNEASLIESHLVENLNPPPAFDTSWVKGGKSAWNWWNGPQLSSVPKAGMNNETIKGFIDFASTNGVPYMLMDEGWYVGSRDVPVSPPGADVTRTISAIDLPGLVDYATSKNVGLRVWVRWDALEPQLEEAFALYERLGVKGVKIDFMDRDDQEMVAFYHRVMARAAAHKLLVNMHGAYHPTGLVRTYPNYLTQEGVMGAEFNKWSRRVTPTHNVTLPFTRGLIGPMDYTPGGFKNLTPQTFAHNFGSPSVQTTRGAALAMYVVYDSAFSGVSDSPDVYAASPAGLDFITQSPATWDETKAVAGEIGQYVIIARRKGEDWWVGAMTNEASRTVKVPLGFLGEGAWSAKVYADGAAPDALHITTRTVTAGQSLTLVLAPAGGAGVRLTPVK